MVVCFANGIQYNQLAEELDKKGYWQYVTGFQRVDYNRRFALVFNRPEPRDHLVEHGLDIGGKHVQFGYQKRRIPPKTRVLDAELPIGITYLEIWGVFVITGRFSQLPRLKRSYKTERLTLEK